MSVGEFWSRATVQESIDEQTATGNVRATGWDDVLTDVEVRLLPLEVTEITQTWATPEEDAYEIHVRGSWSAIRPKMRIVVGADAFDIRGITLPPPFGEPVTRLNAVLVTP